MEHAAYNRFSLNAADIQAKDEELNRTLGLDDPELRHAIPTKIPNHQFQRLLYELLGIGFTISQDECEDIFWSDDISYPHKRI